jgi:hypothetical protein
LENSVQPSMPFAAHPFNSTWPSRSLSGFAALMVLASTFSHPACAVAQRAERAQANQPSRNQTLNSDVPRSQEPRRKVSGITARPDSDSRFSSGEVSRPRTQRAPVSGFAICVGCYPGVHTRQKDRDCLLKKYPHEPFGPTVPQSASRCDRK